MALLLQFHDGGGTHILYLGQVQHVCFAPVQGVHGVAAGNEAHAIGLGHAAHPLLKQRWDGALGVFGQQVDARPPHHNGDVHIVHILFQQGADGVEDGFLVGLVGPVELVHDFVTGLCVTDGLGLGLGGRGRGRAGGRGTQRQGAEGRHRGQPPAARQVGGACGGRRVRLNRRAGGDVGREWMGHVC